MVSVIVSDRSVVVRTDRSHCKATLYVYYGIVTGVTKTYIQLANMVHRFASRSGSGISCGPQAAEKILGVPKL